MRHIDWALIFDVAVIITIGFFTLNSAVLTVKFGDLIIKKQIIFLCLGTAVAFALYMVNYRKLLHFVPFLYGGLLFLLVLTLIVGKVIHGAKSWLDFGFFILQPSEPGKLIAVLTAAYIVGKDKANYLTMKTAVKLIVSIGILVVLILLQPDFGTATVYLVFLAVLLFVLGLDRKIIIFLMVAVFLGGIYSWKYVFKPYQKARILTVINPERDPLGSGYQVIQSKVAVGSGMITGKGYKKGTQSKLRYLPEPHTDFIFAVFSEEFGFIGVSLVLLFYFLMLSRIINIARIASDKQGMVIAVGVVSVLFYQGIVSMGMVVGLIPTTGIPLPFFSYGGSGIITYMAMIGLVLGVYGRRFSVA